MARKFRIKDKVRVIKNISLDGRTLHGVKLGREGKVIDIDIDSEDPYYQYLVKLRGKQHDTWFDARELEKV